MSEISYQHDANCKECIYTPKWICANCGADLYYWNPDYPAVEPHVAYNSLYVKVAGGYGMFFDTDFANHPDAYGFYLCHDCAHELCRSFPMLEKLIDPKWGHIHEEEDE